MFEEQAAIENGFTIDASKTCTRMIEQDDTAGAFVNKRRVMIRNTMVTKNKITTKVTANPVNYFVKFEDSTFFS